MVFLCRTLNRTRALACLNHTRPTAPPQHLISRIPNPPAHLARFPLAPPSGSVATRLLYLRRSMDFDIEALTAPVIHAEYAVLEVCEARFAADKYYVSFSRDIDAALMEFEKAQEWSDLISCLQKLQAALTNSRYSHLPLVPKGNVSALGRTLARCLNKQLPSGVHICALEVYGAVLQRLTPDFLARDLGVYGLGLFSLLQHASERVRPQLLALFSKYILPLGRRSAAALPGIVVALLPG